MLICHEGLPRSGKSYESVVYHLIPALQKPRHVYARVNGLNYEKIAQASGVPLETVQQYLHHLTVEQVDQLAFQKFEVGSLIILDEAQNFWPDRRQPLSRELTTFISEHGHQGLDILWMTQCFGDVHKLFKLRTSQIVSFQKLDALGKGNKYRWRLSKAIKPGKFEEVNAGTKEYEEKYFGTYKSFDPGAEETQLYDDKRANLFASGFFRKLLPVAGVFFLIAFYYVYDLFNGGLAESAIKADASSAAVPAAERAPVAAPVASAASVPVPASPLPNQVAKAPADYIESLSTQYRLRVSGIIQSATKTEAVFEWYDGSLRVMERLPMLALARLGFQVHLDDSHDFATIRRGNVSFVATQFPLDANYGRTSDRQQDAVRGSGTVAGGAPPVAAAPSSGSGGAVMPWTVSRVSEM